MVAAVISLQVRGEAFIVGDDWYVDGFARFFHVAHPDAIEPVDELDRLGGRAPLFRWRDNGDPIGDVLHIRYATSAGHWRGQGPLEHAASSEFTASNLERYAADLAGNGGVPWGLLTNPVDLGGPAARSAQQQWLESSRSRLGAPAVLTGGWDIKALTISPKDMALLELREFDEQRIAAAFGVPPVLVGLSQPGSMNYSSTQMLADWHWRSTLQWLATNICQAISNWALPGDQTLVLDSRPYTQPDLESRSRAYATMADHGALSIPEWRALENLGPVGADGLPGTADDLAAATNLQPTI
jgi:HK97 family phage portal protein